MNHKKLGELGESIVIGELAKLGIDVAIPLSDNYPYDLIIIYDGDFYRAQVKTSTMVSRNGTSTEFRMRKNNWYKRTIKKYSAIDIDVMILCDITRHQVFILGSEDFENNSTFTIRHSDDSYRMTNPRVEQILRGG
jgi:hypothetical protein